MHNDYELRAQCIGIYIHPHGGFDGRISFLIPHHNTAVHLDHELIILSLWPPISFAIQTKLQGTGSPAGLYLNRIAH